MPGKLVIFSAPSGSGKTTIVRRILEKKTLPLEFSISACNRKPRAGEVHGKDYYFLSTEELKKNIDEGKFVEWEEVYPGQFYGTLKSELDRIWAKGKHVVFDIDVIGGINLKKLFGKKSMSVFIQPPSIGELKNRLLKRSTETEESLKRRIEKAAHEMEFSAEFDYVVLNDNLDKATEKVYTLIYNFLMK